MDLKDICHWTPTNHAGQVKLSKNQARLPNLALFYDEFLSMAKQR